MAHAWSRRIHTVAGALELIPATIDQLRGVARYWPMELIDDPDGSGRYGLVFQHGDEEVVGIKLQPVDIEAREARVVHHANRVLIASALPAYLEQQHRGVMVPCAYYKEKPSGLVETGFVFFVGPDRASRPPSPTRDDMLFDARLGAGATRMVFDMVRAIGRVSGDLQIPMMPIIGIEPRPRLAIGGLALHFVIAGPHALVVMDPLDEAQLVWRYVVRAGFATLPYAPMRPMGLPGRSPADMPQA